MEPRRPTPEHLDLRRSISPSLYRTGPLATYLSGPSILEVGPDQPAAGDPPRSIAAEATQATIFAGYRLQDIRNYRAALQGWFGALRIGGHLVVVVPHTFLYERQNAMPSRWSPDQRRLYTPGSLMGEIEEALVPNSYRLRWLGDLDEGYDYSLGSLSHPVGRHDVAVVLEKIEQPSWMLSERTAPEKPAPDYAFEPARTRVEVASKAPHGRILVLKLDHLGDFIMGMPALERVRSAFPDAEITLVVGSWNLVAATRLQLFDHVVPFDGFPRNSGEEKDDVRGTVSAFEAQVTGEFDLAIDLRTDPDTRVLLQSVRARIKAGIGSKAQFRFLDIFLPIDETRRTEAAWSIELPARDFGAQGYCKRNRFAITCEARTVDTRDGAIVWGPYRRLAPGRYLFEPYMAIDWTAPGVLRFDVALNIERIFEGVISGGEMPTYEFTNEEDQAEAEFRLWGVDGEPVPAFQFYGGRLSRQGASSVLHQSEYLAMLIELVAMRVGRYGLLSPFQAVR